MQSPDELFDVCDANDHVVGQATRREVHARQLLHRAVHLWIFRSDGRLVTQRRSATKDQYPNTLTSSASGHVDAGEDYHTAAIRELREELGLTDCELSLAVKLPAGPQTAYEHTVLYILTTDAALLPDPDEVAGLEIYSCDELAREINRPGDNLSPPFRELLMWWLTNEHSATS